MILGEEVTTRTGHWLALGIQPGQLAGWRYRVGDELAGRHGRWRPALGNSDTHLEGQVGIPQTAVLARELSAGAVLDGIRAALSNPVLLA